MFKIGDRVRYIPCKGGSQWQNMTITKVDAGGYWGDDDNPEYHDGYFPFPKHNLELIEPAPQSTTPEQRAMDLIRAIADGSTDYYANQKAARAICAEMEPVDVDLVAAREIASASYDSDGLDVEASDVRKSKGDNFARTKLALAAIAKGRTLERGEG